MDNLKFNQLIIKVHDKQKLSAQDISYIKEDLPLQLHDLPTLYAMREYEHVTGIHISGAPARTYLASYSLILAKKAYGKDRQTGHPLYDAIENRLSIGIMRGYFEGRHPRGYYCCKKCSMAVFPLFLLDLLYWIDGKRLAEEIRPRIEARDPYFTSNVPAKLLAFTLAF